MRSPIASQSFDRVRQVPRPTEASVGRVRCVNENQRQSRASDEQAAARKELERLYRESPLPLDELLVNPGLYIRSSVLAKMLYIDEIYRASLGVPGIVMEFGAWWGQNLVLFANLRAVYEPYDYARKIIGFDTFTGYTAPAPQDGDNDLVAEGRYSVTPGYVDYLTSLMDYHETENTMGHVTKYELVAGDASAETARYLKRHPETIISLAYFDMQLYEPTKACLEAIKPHLVKGSVIAMDELNSEEFPGETIAFNEAIGLDTYPIHKSRYLPDRTYFIVE